MLPSQVSRTRQSRTRNYHNQTNIGNAMKTKTNVKAGAYSWSG